MIDNDKEKLTIKITLPAEYADFADVFRKQNANVLSKYFMHDLIIEIDERKQLLFGLTYNYLAIKL